MSEVQVFAANTGGTTAANVTFTGFSPTIGNNSLILFVQGSQNVSNVKDNKGQTWSAPLNGFYYQLNSVAGVSTIFINYATPAKQMAYFIERNDITGFDQVPGANSSPTANWFTDTLIPSQNNEVIYIFAQEGSGSGHFASNGIGAGWTGSNGPGIANGSFNNVADGDSGLVAYRIVSNTATIQGSGGSTTSDIVSYIVAFNINAIISNSMLITTTMF